MKTTDSHVDRYRASAALGLDLSVEELVDWQTKSGNHSTIALLKESLVEASGHAGLVPDIINYLQGHDDPYVRMGAACHPSVAMDERVRLLGMEPVEELLKNRRTLEVDRVGSHVWTALAESPVEDHRVVVASRSDAPELLLKLASDAELGVRQTVALNRKIPEQAFALLLADEDGRIGRSLAGNPKLPRESALRLASFEDDQVRIELVRNRQVDPEIYLSLAKDPDVRVRKALADNYSAGEAVLATLAQDEDEGVRSAVVTNGKCPGEVAAKLFDQVPDMALIYNACIPQAVVQQIAERNGIFDPAPDLESTERIELFRRVARHANAPVRALEWLGDIALNDDQKASSIRTALLRNREAPESILIRFAQHVDPTARAAVARHQKAPHRVLEQLAKDSDEEVRSAVAGNRRTPEAVSDLLREEFPDEASRASSARYREKRANDNWLQKKWHAYRGKRLVKKFARDNPEAHARMMEFMDVTRRIATGEAQIHDVTGT